MMLEVIEKQARLGQHIPLRCARHPEKIIHAKAPEDFEKFAPDGGCEEPCKTRLGSNERRSGRRCERKS